MKRKQKIKKTTEADKTEDKNAIQSNYCALINKDFDAAMKVIFEETPETETKKPDKK